MGVHADIGVGDSWARVTEIKECNGDVSAGRERKIRLDQGSYVQLFVSSKRKSGARVYPSRGRLM